MKRRLQTHPTAESGRAHIDTYLWVKHSTPQGWNRHFSKEKDGTAWREGELPGSNTTARSGVGNSRAPRTPFDSHSQRAMFSLRPEHLTVNSSGRVQQTPERPTLGTSGEPQAMQQTSCFALAKGAGWVRQAAGRRRPERSRHERAWLQKCVCC